MKLIKKRIFNDKFILINDEDPGISQSLKKNIYFKKWHREPEFMDILNNNIFPNETAQS